MITVLRTHKPITYKLCTDPAHRPFHYWRDASQASVCDCCNWDTAYQGSIGDLQCYPPVVKDALRQELEKKGENYASEHRPERTIHPH